MLGKIGFKEKDIRIIYAFYKNQLAIIHTGKIQAKIKKGVRKGCGLSPLHRSVYIDYLLYQHRQAINIGIKIQETCFSYMCPWYGNANRKWRRVKSSDESNGHRSKIMQYEN